MQNKLLGIFIAMTIFWKKRGINQTVMMLTMQKFQQKILTVQSGLCSLQCYKNYLFLLISWHLAFTAHILWFSDLHWMSAFDLLQYGDTSVLLSKFSQQNTLSQYTQYAMWHLYSWQIYSFYQNFLIIFLGKSHKIHWVTLWLLTCTSSTKLWRPCLVLAEFSL